MKFIRITAILLASLLILTACNRNTPAVDESAVSTPDIPEGTIPDDLSMEDTSGMDFTFTDRDLKTDVDVDFTPLSGDKINITAEGIYVLKGNIASVTVNASDSAKIQIILDNVKINNPDGPAIYISKADKVFITAKENTENEITDGSGYSYSADVDADGAIFSRTDLTVNGTGKITVKGNNKHGIVSKDDLVIANCTLDVNAKNVALNGKDCIKINGSNIKAIAGSDGFRSDNDEDKTRGYVYIQSGKIDITSGNDGIQAETAVRIDNAELNVSAGGGSGTALNNSADSFKGIKAASDIVIHNGSFNINSKDDCIHSNNTVCITNGKFILSSGDDGIHGDTDLSVSGGEITVSKSYEGLESSRIFISGGNINITASDDGLNAAGGNDSSSVGGRPGMGGFSNGIGEIIISGGQTEINASGDGIDSNGTVKITGGVTLVSGPTNNGNGSFDYDGSATVTGGVLIALGSSGMAQSFTNAENQGVIFLNVGNQAAKTTFKLCDENGKEIASYTPAKAYQTAVVTAPQILNGKTYKIVCGETEVSEITMDGLLYGGSGGMGPGGGPGGGHGGKPVRPPEGGNPPDRPNPPGRW